MANTHATLEKVTAWAKRRGFVYPASDLYGGLANTYDYGPYGTQLKENLRQAWWKRFIENREEIYGIDSSIILKADIWEASGHTAGFADVMVEDKVSHKRFRADHLIEEKLEKAIIDGKTEVLETAVTQSELTDVQADAFRKGKVDGLEPEVLGKIIEAMKIKSPDGNELTEPKRFNQLFQTEIGIVAGDKNKAYLRGEIAQGLFMNYKNLIDTFHPKLPFGIGQAGKAFRNEITPGKFTFRTLEFDLMEFEYFFDPENQDYNELFEMWKQEMYDFAVGIGLKPEHLRWRTHEDFERSFYSSRTEDLEYEFTWGFKEIFGLAYRTDYDLKNHMEKSGKNLEYIRQDNTRVIPHVVEPTFGLSRLLTIMIFDAYTEEKLENGTERTVLKINPKLAPVKVAIFPLQKEGELQELAQDIYQNLKQEFTCEFDNSGNIGKMYRRQDEIGTPWCVTVDFDSLADKQVTVRDRDTMQQERVVIAELESYFAQKLK